MDLNTHARQELRDMIDTKLRTVEEIQHGEETLEKARVFLGSLEAEVKAFADISNSVTSSRSAAIRAALRSGASPSIAPSPELAAALARKVDCESRLGAALEVVASIEAEIVASKATVAEAEKQKIWAAERVLIDEADALAADWHRRHAELRRDAYLLGAIAGIYVPSTPDYGPSPTRPINVSKVVSEAIKQRGVIGHFEEHAGPRQRNAIYETVTSYWLALRNDPDAVLTTPPSN